MNTLQTPCLLLDRTVLERNIDQMVARTSRLGISLRVHVKTSKSVDVTRLVMDRGGVGITVSTVKEAAHFLEHGFTDMTYAVGVVPGKLERLANMVRSGASIKLTVDSTEMARAVALHAEDSDVEFEVFIEVDTDGHRMGVDPGGAELVRIAELLSKARGVKLCGVLVHAGESYGLSTPAAIAEHAEQERRLSCNAAQVLRDRSIPCPIVSVGSTPTALCAQSLQGVSEVRPGNFVFFDLFQVGLGVCTTDDIAVRVLSTVIGQNRSSNRLFVDAGALALSKDTGTGGQRIDQRFGLVQESAGTTSEMIVVEVSQEHGTISTRSGEPLDFDRFPIGSQLSILPVHSCMTCAAYSGYHVVAGGGNVEAFWERCHGW